MRYYYKFFKTEEEARTFQKENGGALYKNTPRSRTKRSYAVEAGMAGVDPNGDFCKERPYVIAWNGN